MKQSAKTNNQNSSNPNSRTVWILLVISILLSFGVAGIILLGELLS